MRSTSALPSGSPSAPGGNGSPSGSPPPAPEPEPEADGAGSSAGSGARGRPRNVDRLIDGARDVIDRLPRNNPPPNPKFTQDRLNEAVNLIMRDENKLNHIFASKHKLQQLVSQLGGEENVIRAVFNASNGKLPASGLINNVPVVVNNQTVILRGNVVNGVPRIGTMFVP